jgi:hypothetical protein
LPDINVTMNERIARKIVTAAYRGILGRDPDPEGLSVWVAFLKKNDGLEDLFRHFITSSEFEQHGRSRARPRPLHGEGPVHYFFHIPKTAGLSVHRFLLEATGDLFFPDVFIEDLFRCQDRLHQFKYYAGHFLGVLDCVLQQNTIKATLMRDPLQRSISHYRHLARDPSGPLYNVIRHKTLKQVCTDPELSSTIRNYQARYLATLIVDPLLFRHSIEERQEPEGDALYRAAHSALDCMQTVGVQEDFDLFLSTLARNWRLDAPPTEIRENVATNRPAIEVDADLKKMIYKLTEIDYALYEELRLRLTKGKRRGRNREDG